MLDIKVTHGSYWYGAQIPYWVYIVLTVLPFTGFIGLDHLALRSPLTAFLKFIVNIPLFGYWYFYDIAQALGERELLEKYGIGVPFFGPTGIGAGIFSGSKEFPEGPKQVPRPWKYMLYALTTCIFIAFPINKLVIGDYWGALAQLLMYACFFTIITPILAVAWGLYDIYRVGFDTKGLFEKGAARFLPASWVMAPYFRRDAMGSLPAVIVPPSWVGNIVEKVAQVPIAAAEASTEVIGEVRNASKELVHEVSNASTGAVGKLSNASTGLAGKVIEESTGLVGQVSNATTGAVAEARQATNETIHNLQSIVSSPAKANIVGSTLELTEGAVKELSSNAKEVGNRAVQGMQRFPVIMGKVATGAAHNISQDTVVPITTAIKETTAAVQQGVENTTAAATAIANKTANAVEHVASNATSAASNIAEHAASNVSQGIIQRVNAVTGELGKKTTDTYGHVANNAAHAANEITQNATEVSDALKKAAISAAINPNPLINATSQMATHVSQDLGRASEHITKDSQEISKALGQSGGALILSSDPSLTTVILLFSLGFIAVSGYIFYTLRKLDKQPVEKSDDPPGEPRAVRESDKPSK